MGYGTSRHALARRKGFPARFIAVAMAIVMAWGVCLPLQSLAADSTDSTDSSQATVENATSDSGTAVDDTTTDTSATDGSSTGDATTGDTTIDDATAGDTTTDNAVKDDTISDTTPVASELALPAVVPLAAQSVTDAITPQDTGVHFAKLELHKSSPDGTLVCDLLTNTNPTLEAGQEYYLDVEVDKNAYTDDCWVSLSFPWWTTPINMIGGDSWMTPGASVTATALDKVVDYSANTGYSTVLTSTAGKVTYHIKSTEEAKVQKAAFEVSFKPTAAYFDTNSSGQTWTNSKLSFACGDMSGSTAGAAKQTISTGTVTATGSGGFSTYGTKFPNCGLNSPYKSSRDYWISGAGANTVWKTIEFDATYPADTTTVGDITFGGFTATKGAETTNPDGTKTIHCTINTEGAQAGGLAATASFSLTGEKTMTFTNVTATTWGDETTYTIPGSTDLKWYVYDGPGTIKITSTDITRFNWCKDENVTNDMLLGFAHLTCTGGDPMQLSSTQTIDVTYASNQITRAITIPLYNNHATTVTLNGTSYNLADVATKVVEPAAEENGNGYAVISATKAGLTQINTCVFNMGKLQGGADTATGYNDQNPAASDYADRFEDLHLASWGSYNDVDGTSAVSTYKVYPTETPANVQTATGTEHPTATKTMTVYSEPNGGTLSKTAMMCGDTTHFSANFTTGIWPQTQGQTSAYDDTEAYYLTLPVGFKVKNLTLDGVSVTPEDVTSTCSNVPTGMKIYKITYPAGQDRQMGIYTTDLTGPYRNVQFDLTTSPYLNAGTYSMSSLFQIATSPDAAVDTQYTGIWGNTTLPDTYGVNGGKTVTAPTAQFTIQPFNGVSVTNSMYLVKNGKPLNQWFTYNEADTTNTIGKVSKDFSAVYKVTVTNETDRTASNVRAFVAVPKIGQNFGEAYTPEGAQMFDLTFTARDIPDGWTVHYLKINSGKTYAVGEYPHEGDYTEVTDPSQADMIMIEGANDVGAGESSDITFNVTSPDDLNTILAASDIWGCNTRYEADGSEIVPQTMFPEALETGAFPQSTPEVAVTKTVDKSDLTVGDTANYTITVSNNSDTAITNYYLVDTMPDFLDYTSSSDSGVYDSDARTITWNFDSIEANESKTVTVVAKANAVGTATNIATVYGHDPLDPTKPDFTTPIDQADATVNITAAPVPDNPSSSTTTTTATTKSTPKTGDALGLMLALAAAAAAVAGAGTVIFLRRRHSTD